MRNHWRLLLLLRSSQQHISRSIYHSHSSLQVQNSFRCFSSSFLHSRAHHLAPLRICNSFRFFSTSDLAVDHKAPSDQVTVLYDIFSNADKSSEDIRVDLESNGVGISHDLVLRALRNQDFAPESARRFFDWVSENESERLSSKAYNLMLGILVNSGNVKEFWEMVDVMKKKGYGVSKGAFDRALGKFEKEGLSGDVQKLNQLYASGSTDNSIEKVCKIIRQNVWDDNVEKQLKDINYTSDLVSMVLANLQNETSKALIFFRWIEESGLLKHDERAFNAMARVLGREDSTEKFWRVIGELRDAGYEMERATYVEVLEHFVKRKMIKEAVELYEFAMAGANKPSLQDCTLLLKKIVVSKELDLDLFSKVVRVFTESGNLLTNNTLDAVLKSLTSVARWEECNNILKALEKFGLLPNGSQQSKIAYHLSSCGKTDEVTQFVTNMDASGSSLNYKTWVSLVDGYCAAGDLSKASDTLEKMIGKEGPSHAGCALELLVSAYCRKKRTNDALALVKNMVSEKELRPWQSTYKLLVGKLLVGRQFSKALDVLHMMKDHGYPPCLDPFIKYLSENGSADDAIAFSEAMTVKRFPSTSVILRLFEAYFKAGRQSAAQDFLAKCPKYIRDNADVLELFYSMQHEKAATTQITAA
nr:pentatricopeptide repeat-containing protein At3g02490, mitochondrial-like [Ipomoea batatas]